MGPGFLMLPFKLCRGAPPTRPSGEGAYSETGWLAEYQQAMLHMYNDSHSAMHLFLNKILIFTLSSLDHALIVTHQLEGWC